MLLTFRQFCEASGMVHEYACALAPLPELLPSLLTLQKNIAPEDLIKAEDEPHITVLYGLHSDNPEPVKKLLAAYPPPAVTILGLSLFSSPESDVLKFGIESPGLATMNAALRGSLTYTNNYKDYVPHMTVAYLRPGTGKKYLSLVADDLVGRELQIRHISLSGADNRMTTVFSH